MSVKTHIPCATHPYHVSVRTNNADWFGLPLSEVWEIYSDYLHFASRAFQLEIHSFVLMSNHFHMIARTPQANLSEAMNYLNREVSKEISRQQRRMNHNFKNRYFRAVLSSYHHYLNVYKYVYRNPVEAGLALRVEHYKYSTLSGLLGQTKMHIPLVEDTLLAQNELESTLNWLNEKPSEAHYWVMKKALKKRVFNYPKDRRTNRLHILEKQLY